ncbi:MAG: DM13 domain-containing protein [Cenarchaeum sp. SB0661_bin_35]|nr:DM13 domain-containing protein [Cenarchaeum sp. SB0667_bin_13]MXZ93001.1 DM13 domain-containing protein [Cenarchaeum sp. SB0666_bin_15]MYB47189.1 DM13 domain-containing protein [Cenarchaeum sp. SB0662_bin_33]MYC79512.1 DM13 domain-containing protein [Cenarchaeum sp. SB0661_bin_35]MYD58539.1 DM13 domain-containing protein [Cenarchaeum sp. SB0678_bin_8]MYG33255.1 DM13 domain-containing protein [Cenarchaeum sp. SB0677_bin_16]
MKKSIVVLAGVLIAVGIAVYALSPYLLESEINEDAPSDIASDQSGNALQTYGGTFVGVNDGIHNAEGVARVLSQDDGGQILRLEDFYSTNGPDLYVYLSIDKGDDDIVNLGKLKANRGNQNYAIPDGTDLEKYDHVLVWCRPFSVLFGSAQLMPQE